MAFVFGLEPFSSQTEFPTCAQPSFSAQTSRAEQIWQEALLKTTWQPSSELPSLMLLTHSDAFSGPGVLLTSFLWGLALTTKALQL